MVFDSAMAKVKDIYWRNLRFAGQRVTVHVEPSGEALIRMGRIMER